MQAVSLPSSDRPLTDTSENVDVLIRLAREALHREPRRAVQYALAAEGLALAQQNTVERFEALCIVASASLSLSDFTAAETVLASIASLTDTPGRQARYLSLRAIRAQRAGDMKAALSLVFDALDLLENSEEAQSQRAAMTHNLAGNLLSQFADYAGAIEHFHRALALFANDPDNDITAVIANNLGRAHRELEQYAEAEAMYRQALARFSVSDSSLIHAALLSNLGQLLIDTGRPQAAFASLNLSLDICKKGNFARMQGGVHNSMGIAHHALQNIDDACLHFQTALEIRRSLGEFLDLCETKVCYAKLLVALERFQEVRDLLDSLLNGSQATGWQRMRVDALHVLYGIERRQGNLERALDLHVAYHEQSKVFWDHHATQRYQALQIRHRVAQLAREREAERRQRLANEVLAYTDSLTNLPNRRFMDQHIQRLCCEGSLFTVVLVDIDHFKRVNDTYSHALGDKVLGVFSTILQKHLRTGDVVGRYGGEEFVLVLDGCGMGAAAEICGRLLVAISSYPWSDVQEGLALTASMGLAQGYANPACLLDAADTALYKAKANGRNQVVCAPVM